MIAKKVGGILKFLRKHRFNILITFLVTVLIIVSFYMLWVHVPYWQYQNDLSRVEAQIIQENDYDKADYFYRYNGEKSYYIIHASRGKKAVCGF